MVSVTDNCIIAKSATDYMCSLSTEQKNEMLGIIADALTDSETAIIAANTEDLSINSDKPAHILDRLTLNAARLRAMSDGIKQLVALPDPVGEKVEVWTNHVGLKLMKVRVPFGVVAIIYEARPNVTADAIGLCLKTGNAVVLRGSRDAYNSNLSIVTAMKNALESRGYRSEFIQLVEDLSHESSQQLMTARDLVDVLIPRGSKRLIDAVVNNSSVPIIETGTGNCHAYVHSSADLNLAEKIILNGKLRRPSVCNTLESLLVDEEIAAVALPKILGALRARGVTIYGCEKTTAIFSDCHKATDDDYYTEYLDLKISCKVVKNAVEAIAHIEKYGSHHSEVIIATDLAVVDQFMKLVDSAAVYHNASTAFTDGFEFGFGAEMGISTQKLHARGPLGLRELTSTKYCIYGDGQVRK